ncbi:MAG: cytochrome-c peroxidase [Pyrinomonadaceae bacterium]
MKTNNRLPSMLAQIHRFTDGCQIVSYVFVLILSITLLTQAFQRKRARAPSEAVPVGIGKNLWRNRIPANNPLTAAKVGLGRSLYFDKRLSVDGTVSCATCHDPANAFTDHSAVATGVSNRTGTRNAPTILNAMFSERLFWDGRAGSLEEQAKQPLINQFEMGMGNYAAVVERVAAISEYRRRFQSIFRTQGITIETIVKAIAAYERTLLSGNSPFDRFMAGDQSAITAAQKRGFELFKGKARCVECHSFSPGSPFFTDFKFHNTGVVAKNVSFEQLSRWASQIANKKTEGSENKSNNSTSKSPMSNRQTEESAPLLAHTEGFTELGRYLVTKQPKDIGAFKTPTLRDVELTTPYMHNGWEKTLIDVVRFYNRGGNVNPKLDERMQPLHLSDEEINELVEFMRALTSDDVLLQSQRAIPQTRKPLTVRPLSTKQ